MATGSSRSGTSSSCSSSSSTTAANASCRISRSIPAWGSSASAAVLQGKHDNYDTDLMRSLIEASAQATWNRSRRAEGRIHHRVIADHLRSTSFLIADGVMPSNEGRGYVLRRIMRRAMRHAHLLGAQDPLMHRLVPALVRQMGQAYPGTGPRAGADRGDAAAGGDALQADAGSRPEAAGRRTGATGGGCDAAGRGGVPLYDTFGFPLDLTQDALREPGARWTSPASMRRWPSRRPRRGRPGPVRARRRMQRSGSTSPTLTAPRNSSATIPRRPKARSWRWCVTAPVETAAAGRTVQIALNQTPFYAEAGGQVGDTGWIRRHREGARDRHPQDGGGVRPSRRGRPSRRSRPARRRCSSWISDRRAAIRANHSATHLLHEALRQALGDHVAQRGSLNAPDRLRFDFSHTKALSGRGAGAGRGRGQRLYPAERTGRDPDDDARRGARDRGAGALWREIRRRGARRLDGVAPGSGKGLDGETYSIELCGGTHVGQTGEIGLFVCPGRQRLQRRRAPDRGADRGRRRWRISRRRTGVWPKRHRR
jgi:alanyl-tRNA synthetase